MGSPRTTKEKWLEDRDDLTGEHGVGDAGQGIFAVLFFAVWVLDSFVMPLTTQLSHSVPPAVRLPVGIVLLILAGYLAWTGLSTVFHQVRETPAVIRYGIFSYVRHPIYFSEVLLYLGLFVMTLSLAAGVVGLVATGFLYYISRYEERLLIARFGEEYRAYMRDVGFWVPRRRR